MGIGPGDEASPVYRWACVWHHHVCIYSWVCDGVSLCVYSILSVCIYMCVWSKFGCVYGWVGGLLNDCLLMCGLPTTNHHGLLTNTHLMCVSRPAIHTAPSAYINTRKRRAKTCVAASSYVL